MAAPSNTSFLRLLHNLIAGSDDCLQPLPGHEGVCLEQRLFDKSRTLRVLASIFILSELQHDFRQRMRRTSPCQAKSVTSWSAKATALLVQRMILKMLEVHSNKKDV